MLSVKSMFTIVLVAGLVMVGVDAFAAPNSTAAGAGGSFLETLEGLVTGNIGLMVGLALAILGIYTWVVKQETSAGIMLIIGGVLITVAPGIFNSFKELVSPIVTATGASDLKSVNKK